MTNNRLAFIFQYIFHMHLSVYPVYQQACEGAMQKNDAGCWLLSDSWPGRFSATFSRPSAKLLYTMYCSSRMNTTCHHALDSSQSERHWR